MKFMQHAIELLIYSKKLFTTNTYYGKMSVIWNFDDMYFYCVYYNFICSGVKYYVEEKDVVLVFAVSVYLTGHVTKQHGI